MCKRIEQGAFKNSKGWYFHRLIEKPRPDGGNGSQASTPSAQSKAPKAFRNFEDAAKAAAKTAGGGMAGQWVYFRSDGTEFARVVRFNLPDGDKQFRPIYEGKIGWKIGDPSGLWPLYRVSELPADGLAWLCEGEKAADAARAIGLAAVTSAHGSSAAEKSDWGPLSGRDVIILPDADEPGEKYAQEVSRLLMKLDPPARVKIVKLPDLPPGGDIVEFDAAIGDTPDATNAAIVKLAAATPWLDRTDLIGGLGTRCLADVEAEDISWLWPSRFALGKLSLIGGIPGAGKSWLTLFIAAAISRAMPWPDGRGNAPLGSVLIANAEDGTADTLKPRLEKMGADCRKIHVIDCVKRPSADGKLIERGFTMADIGQLEDSIRRLADCRAVVIDPVSAFLCDADEYKNGEVRSLLKPLARMAERYGVAIILVTHLTKGGGANSVHRMIGSIAFAGAARSVWMLAKDPKNPARRLLLLAKCNVAADEGGLAYSIVGGSIAFEAGAVTDSADDVLAEQNAGDGGEDVRRGPAPEARTAAEAWLRNLLAAGEVSAATVKAEASASGMSYRTVQRAADAIGVIREKNSFDGGWQWRFPRGTANGDSEGDRFGENEIPVQLSPSGNSTENGDSVGDKSEVDKLFYSDIFDNGNGRDRGIL